MSVIHVETDCQKMSSGKVGGRRRITSLLRDAAVEGCGTMVTGAGVMQLGGSRGRGRKRVMAGLWLLKLEKRSEGHQQMYK